MVAAAPTEGTLRPAVATGLLVLFAVLLGLAAWTTKYAFVYRLAPLNESPEVLRVRARDLIQQTGLCRFATRQRRRNSSQAGLSEVYRGARSIGKPMAKTGCACLDRIVFGTDKVRAILLARFDIEVDKPALDVSGMTSIYLDMDGRLHWFMHVPPQREPATANQLRLSIGR